MSFFLVLFCRVLSCLFCTCLCLRLSTLSSLVNRHVCLVLSCPVLLCLVVVCVLVISCLALLCLCLVLSSFVLSCLVCHTCHVVPCLILFCLVFSVLDPLPSLKRLRIVCWCQKAGSLSPNIKEGCLKVSSSLFLACLPCLDSSRVVSSR